MRRGSTRCKRNQIHSLYSQYCANSVFQKCDTSPRRVRSKGFERGARRSAIKGATDAGVEADCFHPTEENEAEYAEYC